MKFQLLFFFLLSGIGLTAQTYHPFPTKNTMWTEMYFNPYPNEFSKFHSFALKDNDTTINGKLYHKIYHSNDTTFTEANLCGAIREENKKVYYYSIESLTFPFTGIKAKTEALLYDFSLKLGDTIMSDSFRISHPDRLKVFKIDSILIGSEYRKTYSFGYLNAPSEMPYATWVEGIGHLRGLLFATGDVPNNGLWNDLICFKQNNAWLFHYNYYNNCIYRNYDAINELSVNNKILVSPNPIHSKAHIEFGNTKYLKLTIANLSGKVLKEYQIEGKSSIDIGKGELSNGLYILSIYEVHGNILSTKILFE